MIDEHKLLLALVDAKEVIDPFVDSNASILLHFSVENLNSEYESPTMRLGVTASFSGYFHQENGAAARAWLENDSRTEMDSWGDLVLKQHIPRDGYYIAMKVSVPLSDDEKQLVRDLGKLVEQTFTLPAVAC